MDVLGLEFGGFDLQGWLESVWVFVRPRLLPTLAIAVLGWLAYRVARFVLHRFEQRVAKRTATELDDLLVRLVRRVILIGIIFWVIWRTLVVWTLDGVGRFVVAAGIIAVSIPVSHFVGDVLRKLEARISAHTASSVDDTALPMVNKVVRFLVVGTGALIALEYLSINIAPLLAGAGVLGIAFSFAAKDTLSNLIAGVLLIIDRPFQVGDRIELWNAPAETGTWGDVVEIGLRATKIRNPDNLIIIIPNNEIMRRDIVNYTASGSHIRLRIPFGISYESSTKLAKELILRAAMEAEGVKQEPAPIVIRRGIGASELNLQLRVWISDARDRRRIADEITGRVRELFEEHGVEIPYPKQDLYIKTLPAGGTAPGKPA